MPGRIRIFLFPSLFFIVTGITTNPVFGLTISDKLLPDTFKNEVYDAGIHTVLLNASGWEFSLPVLDAGSLDQLELRFDDLSEEPRNFGYAIYLCNASWQKSELPEQDYISGFPTGVIREARASFNTTFDYFSYRLLFPEENCELLLSGNYALVVFDQDNPDKIVLSRRFYVTEKQAQIQAKIKPPLYGSRKETSQQLELVITYNNNEIRDPLSDLKVVVMQNGRDDLAAVLGKPYSVSPGRLEYTDPGQGFFPGGNEFRSIDLKSMRYQTENMDAIEFRNPYFHVIMKPDAERSGKRYFSKTDLNGNFYIDREKAQERHEEADYVYVHFKLAIPPSHAWENIYVTGAFCDWKRTAANQMQYNDSINHFELKMLLKQGLYDYCYMMADPETGMVNEYALEGSYYETGNDYAIFVYYLDGRLNHHRLMGYLPIK
ncbi:MAG: DUF5103 domain-containing protein [Bacteroidales bacterium]|nr:DUF5103 domain-containing protein [Bacteroidales bacterium]